MGLILLTILIITDIVLCTIDGLYYQDPHNFKPLQQLPAEDPCNPLYWYPRQLPEYCYHVSTTETSKPYKSSPIPLPIPIPLPPQPIPFPILPIPPIAAPIPSAPIPIPPIPPQPIIGPLPYGIPLEPTNPLLPAAGLPYLFPQQASQPYLYPFPQRQAGLVPGLPGLISQDGGINILPFSDVYADLLEKHKQKKIRKRLQKLLDRYDGWPKSRRTRIRHKNRKVYYN